MAYFRCTTGGSGKGNTLVVTCADELAGATITCTNGTKTYTKTCPSTAPYEVTFYGLAAGTWTISATVSGNTYTTTVVVSDYEAELGGFNWKTWVNLSQNYTSSDFTDLDDLLSDETAVRELMTIHDCVDYLAGTADASADVETIIGNDLCAKWINLRDYALDTLYANTVIKGYMDTADKYFYGEWALMPQVPPMTSNTTPYGVASASSYYNSQGGANYAPYKAFNGSITATVTDWWFPEINDVGNYLKYKFVSPVCVKKLKLYLGSYTYTPGQATFVVSASNDDSTYTEIGTVTATGLSTSASYLITSYDVDLENDTSYLYYKITCNSVMTITANNVVAIAEAQFYSWQPKGNVPVMTSNTAPYGVASATSEATNFAAYKMFDGDLSTGSSFSTSLASGYIQYKFANPINVKRIAWDDASSAGATTLQLSYSDDGSSFINAGAPFTYTLAQKQTIVYFDVDDDYGYHLYWKVTRTLPTTGQSIGLMLQFYGRELTNLIGPISSNTNSKGTVTASSEWKPTGYDFSAYKAFDVDSSTYWVNTNWQTTQTNEWVQFEFNKKQKILFTYNNIEIESTTGYATSGQLQYYNDDTSSWTALYASTSVPINNGYNTEYETTKIRFLTTSNANCAVSTINVFGLDYSEREFEEGTTKKWLYDHGVELETANTPYGGGSNTYINYESSRLVFGITDGASVIIPNWSVDFTNYNLARAKITNNYNVDKNDLRAMNSSGTYIGGLTFTTVLLPNNIGYDVSSINQDGKLGICVQGATNTNTNGHTELAELWLE